MQTHTDIINRWPSLSDFAADIGVKYVTAQAMRYRGAIGRDHWDNAVDAAQRRGFGEITHALLSRTAPKRRTCSPRRNAA